MSCGAHLTLFTTGRGSVVGSAVAPVIKITGNPETFARMGEDMDIDAGRIMLGDATLDAVGEDIFDLVLAVAGGAPSKSERSEEHTSELQSLMRISYAVFCLKKKINKHRTRYIHTTHHTQLATPHYSTLH